ncbi:MAG: response regulator, partial [Planctomycetota bacterium]
MILIVDDEEINIKVTAKYLREAGYGNFVTTFDDANAFSLIGKVRPDIILLDVMMPNVSGLEILEQVRDTTGLSQTPVLILTASTDREIKVRALQAGATDFLA